MMPNNFYAIEEDGAIERILFGIRTGEASKLECIADEEIRAYLSGTRRIFSFPIRMRGTAFQCAVWEKTRAIPYGETVTYGELARSIGTNAVRALGSALRKNKLPIVIPCHRVIAKNGLGGYAYGEDVKSTLLRLECRSKKIMDSFMRERLENFLILEKENARLEKKNDS